MYKEAMVIIKFKATIIRILKDFLFWMLDKGQTMTQALSYAPLPNDVVTKEKAAITSQVKP